ncbi:hypothetical protein CEXT_231711 [Caerostris extrusa]|uniref:C2H2-type domain-containing protein n=1 Tax=Caerostris extrusa TaxID=172846 RepID=A0AAV4SBF1_CAEEX|nr:hypothetical protein CEXT_231711 [Caerostris extrusa]
MPSGVINLQRQCRIDSQVSLTETATVCEEEYNFSVKLNQHGLKMYCCANCNYSTPYKSSLKTHAVTHRNVRPFECSVCHKQFKLREGLKSHFRLHSGEKPYKCKICGETFAQHAAMKYHFNKSH